MGRIITDAEIQALLSERKVIPANWQTRLRLIQKAQKAYAQRDFDLTGDGGHQFKIVLRQSNINPADFSIILTFVDEDGHCYNLTRFNGSHPSPHTNRIEHDEGKRGHQFSKTPHIHVATERYQRIAKEIESFALPTKRYNSFVTALSEFVRSNGIEVEGDDDSPRLFRH